MTTQTDPRPVLLFISPRFLFPVDSGGKIRTTQILRGLKGGRFRIRLLSPGSARETGLYAPDLATVCDEFAWWPSGRIGSLRKLARASYVLGRLPIPVRDDDSRAARDIVSTAIRDSPAVVVFDFLHSAVLAPIDIASPSVLFTHNVETEIFARHRDTATNPLMRAVWASQTRKMATYERQSLSRFDVVVAVSDRDAAMFNRDFDCSSTFVIPTGVDTDYFRHHASSGRHEVVFCGSMDWLANQDGILYFMNEVWPLIVRDLPLASMRVIGRAPPDALVKEAQRRGLQWTFTGFVDDVREHVRGADVSIIPLRIGGGTRLKVYESMAMGPVVVSTAIGVEGLPVVGGQHCLVADDPVGLASAVVALLHNPALREKLSATARDFVVESCGYRMAAGRFEAACVRAMECSHA